MVSCPSRAGVAGKQATSAPEERLGFESEEVANAARMLIPAAFVGQACRSSCAAEQSQRPTVGTRG